MLIWWASQCYEYRKRAIISRGLYISFEEFLSLCKASIQERVMIARVG